MAALSAPLLDRPYLNDAAGEGAGHDPDPPARYDVFDCLTFVEEVLALALPADPRSAPAVRQALRYADGRVAYEARNHFMLAQWIPHNLANGLLADITGDVGDAHLLTKDITAATWRWWGKRSLFAVPDEALPVGRFTLPVLSLGAAEAALDRIPDGALLITVRRSREGVPIVVTHLGFKVPGETGPRLRHATRMGTTPRVRDDRLSWYLEHVRWYDRWPVEGISVLMPQEAGPRSSRLARHGETPEPTGVP